MKRLLVILLTFALIVGLMSPVFASEEYTVSFDGGNTEISSPRAVSLPTSSKRGDAGDNLILPGSLTDGMAVSRGTNMTLSFAAIQTGKAGQYWCILFFRGTDIEADPIAYKYGQFSRTAGIREITTEWVCSKQPAGEYTVLACTAVPQGDSLIPVDGTAFAVTVHILDKGTAVPSFFLTDWQSGEELNEINLSVGELSVVAWSRTPLPSYNLQTLSQAFSAKLAQIHYAAGLLFIEPLRCGSGYLSIMYGDRQYSYLVNICNDSGGHHIAESVVAREPNAEDNGINVHYCDRCGYYIRERVPAYGSAFHQFGDLSSKQWYYNYVKQATGLNLFNGVSKTRFDPEGVMTRAMLVTVLWRYEGQPKTVPADFVDVPEGSWYADAVAWASEQGIVNGVGKGKFDPNSSVTREQMATILHRYAVKSGLEGQARVDLTGFDDEQTVSSWAVDALSWAVAHGVITGSGSQGTLSLLPLKGATRAQVSAILVRFIENIAEAPEPVAELDLTDAIDHGTYGEIQWAYYPGGVLRFSGKGTLVTGPWSAYKGEIKTVEILSQIEELDAKLFLEMKALKKVWMADSVRKIGSNCFQDCIFLTDIRLSPNTEQISNEAFRNCKRLEEIDLPHGLKLLGWAAFQKCIALKEIVIPDSIVVAYDPGLLVSTEGIGRLVFNGCQALERVVLPVGLSRIPELLFQDCISLKEVVYPPCAYDLGSGTLYGCTAVESFAILPNVYDFRNGMFTGCTSLKEVYVLNPDMTFLPASKSYSFPLDELPFGDPATVVVYGIVGSTTQEAAEKYGYQFIDITSVIE